MSDTTTTPTVIPELKTITHGCLVCGTYFAIQANLYEAKLETGDQFCCPNGHGLKFKDTEAKTSADLRAQVKELEKKVQHLSQRWEESGTRLSKCRDWIRRSGHLISCEITPSSPCTCGYTDMLETP